MAFNIVDLKEMQPLVDLINNRFDGKKEDIIQVINRAIYLIHSVDKDDSELSTEDINGTVDVLFRIVVTLEKPIT
jgi:hypothetical protein